MVQDAGTAGKWTMLTRYWHKGGFELLWHKRYVLTVRRMQCRSPRSIVFSWPYCQHDIASIANHEGAEHYFQYIIEVSLRASELSVPSCVTDKGSEY